MKLKKSLFLRSFFILAVVMGFGISSAFAATIKVTSKDDEINGDDICSMREAFESAETNAIVGGCLVAGDDNNDTIDLTGITGLITLDKGEYFFKSDLLTIQGPGADQLTLDAGNNPHRFLSFEAANQQRLTLSGFTLTHFSSDDPNQGFGGALYVRDIDKLFLTDVNFVKNSATNGGAVYNEGGDIEISNNLFSQNQAVNGGAIFNAKGKITVTKSTFSENSAKSVGGAIANIGKFSLVQSTVDNNKAGELGGGISAETGDFVIDRSTISNNSAPGAAAIFTYGTMDIMNSTISGNKAQGYVGGVYVDTDGELTLTHVTIANNFADMDGQSADATGTGLYQADPSNYLSMENTIIADNKKGSDAGTADDCFATVGSGGVNLIGNKDNCIGLSAVDLVNVDAHLKPLAVNAPGVTATMALDSNSPAIDASDFIGATVDQREVTRPKGTKTDIGAFEYDPAIDAPVVPQQPQGNSGGPSGGSDISAQNSGNSGSGNAASNGGAAQPPANGFVGGGTSQDNTPAVTPPASDTAYVGAGSAAVEHPFTDITGNFAESEIVKLFNDCGITGFTDANGKSLQLYRPNLKIKRDDLIIILVKCRFGEQKALAADAERPFPDVAVDYYAAPYIAKAKAEKIVSGFKDGNFHGTWNATRAEAAKMIVLTWFSQVDVDAVASQPNVCTDLEKGAWYLPYFNFTLKNNIMSGYTGKDGKPLYKCGPIDNVLRSETAKMTIRTKELAKM